MPQNRQIALLKCSPMWKNMRKSFKTIIPKAWKREAMAVENRDSNSTFILFYLNLTIWFSCLKTSVYVSWVGAYLWGFF